MIRRGDRGEEVAAWQSALISAGYSLEPFGADGVFGALTSQMTKAFQANHRLVADGVVGAKTLGVMHGRARGVASQPSTKAPFQPIGDRAAVFGAIDYIPAPTTTNPEGIKILGNWVRENIVRVYIPQLCGVVGAPRSGNVAFHRLGAEQLRRTFEEWESEGLLPHVISFAGTWAPRFIRGSRSVLSNHAYGTAIDINAAWNMLGATPAAMGTLGSVRELVPIAHDHGFFWGGDFRGRPDGMHFEVARVRK